MLRSWLAAVILLLAAPLGSGPAAAFPDTTNQYRLDVAFDPRTGEMSVEGTLTIVADGPRDRIELLLNKAFDVRRFTYGEGRAARIEREVVIGGQTLPKTQMVVIPLETPLQRGDRLETRFAYAGRLNTEDIEIGRGVVSPAWTELTSEAAWYPWSLNEPMLRSWVTLTTPAEYAVVAPGRAERLGPGRWRLDPLGPISGRITFAMSDRWTVERRALSPRLSASLYTVAPEPRAREILDAVGGAYGFYQGLFGPPRTEKSALTLLYANRPIGLKYANQAYSTGGDFIVLDGSAPQSQQDALHHEVAHLWWSAGRPGTPDEFMSESVSEYLALRRGEQVWGADWLKGRRAAMERDSAAIQARLLDIDGFDGKRQPLMYQRGPAALWALHDRIGAAAMDGLLQAAYAERIDTLAGFQALLGKRQGLEVARMFEARL